MTYLSSSRALPFWHLLPLALLVLATPVRAQSASDFTTSSDGAGGLIITGYTGTVTAVVIPSPINGKTVTGIGSGAFQSQGSLTSVTIPYGVTSIGDNAFDQCGLRSVTIPNSVTSLGNGAFSQSYLTSVNIPASVTSMGTDPFAFCIILGSITVDPNNPDFMSTTDGVLFNKNQTLLIEYPAGTNVTSYSIPTTVTSIGDSAFGDTSLTSVNLPASVTSIGNAAFAFASSLTSASFNGNAPTMGGAVFYIPASGFKVYYNTDATGFTPGSGTWTADATDSYPTVVITYTTVSDTHGGVIINGYTANTLPPVTLVTPTTIGGKNVTGIGSGNEGLNGISEAHVIVSPGVTSLGDFAFQFCSLTSITLPNGLTTIGQSVFDLDTHLTSITFPATVTSIGASAFQFAEDLTTATFNGPAPTMGSGVFDDAPLNLVIYYNNAAGFATPTWTDSSGDQFTTADFGTSIASNQVTITSYTGPNTITIPAVVNGLPVTSIGSSAFKAHGSLTSVTIPYGVTNIGSEAFEACSGLTSVTIPASVTSLGDEAFDGCALLASITIPNSVTTIGNDAFEFCHDLASATIPPSVTNLGFEAFYGTSLTTANIPASVTSIGYAPFGFCTKVAAITVDPNNPDFIGTSDGILMSKDQTLLINYPAGKSNTTYTIPSTVTIIGPEAFVLCQTLTSVTIPNATTSIGEDAFGSCSSLTSITIPASVTSIGVVAFSSCSSLTSITIPASVTSLGLEAFQQCSALSTATFNGNAPTMGGFVFDLVANNFTVKYYDGANGFPASSGTWTPDANDSYPAIDLSGLAFSTWISSYSGVTDTAPGDTPFHDGVPNLLKFLYHIDPSRAMTANDRGALPAYGIVDSGGKSYLTLTYGRNQTTPDLTYSVETSTNLVTWTPLVFTSGTPVAGQYNEADTGTNDPNGDPYMKIQVLLNNAKQFIRLNVINP